MAQDNGFLGPILQEIALKGGLISGRMPAGLIISSVPKLDEDDDSPSYLPSKTREASKKVKTNVVKTESTPDKKRTLGDKDNTDQIVDAEIVHIGDKLILPAEMSYQQAIDLLTRRMGYMDEPLEMSETFDVFPNDGAIGLESVLTEMYGWAHAVSTPGFFWFENPPELINVEVAPNVYRKVPWGSFALPNLDGHKISCGVDRRKNRYVFKVTVVAKRKHEQAITKLFAALRTELKTNSIYRGQAIQIRFKDDRGNAIPRPEPRFIDTAAIDSSMLIFSDRLKEQIETNLFTPIQRTRDVIDNGIRVKRTVLLEGTFGTGKTMAASVASKYAVESGITFLYVSRADEITEALEFAVQYQSPACVIFCEDVDRVTSGARSTEMDDILNKVDGIDSKTVNIILVLTTNDVDSIHPAMRRPGRIDAIIPVTPPDSGAIERLMRSYAKGSIHPDTNLSEAAKLLEAQKAVPAAIAEVVNRAKLAQLKRQAKGTRVENISAEAVLEAAHSIIPQIEGLRGKEEIKPTSIEDLVRGEVEKVVGAKTLPMHNVLNGLVGRVEAIAAKISA